MSWSLDGQALSSVLLTRLRYLGDIVMSTVVAEVLRDGDPDLEIGYLCEEGFAPVLADHPDVSRVHSLVSGRRGSDAKARAESDGDGPGSKGTLGTILELRRAGYDLAVDLFFNPRSAWLLALAGIGKRIGGTRKSRGRLYTHQVLRSDLKGKYAGFSEVAPGGLGEHLCRLAPLVHTESGQPFVARLTTRFEPGALVPRIGRPCFGPQARRQLSEMGIGEADPFLLLAPSATWPSKEWPPEHWRSLIELLVADAPYPIVVLAAPGRDDGKSGFGALIPEGRGGVLTPLPLAEALAVTAAARLLVTVDGGIMHAAVGQGTPTVALFGPTDPRIWFPYGEAGPFRVLALAPHCHPCDLHECAAFICLPDLQPMRVLKEVAGLLEATDHHPEASP